MCSLGSNHRWDLSCLSHSRSSQSYIPSEIGWLLRQIRPLLRLHIASIVCITATSCLQLLNPLTLKWMIDRIIPQGRAGLLVVAVAMIFAGHIGRMALTNLGDYLMLTAAQKMGLSLRMTVLRQIDSLSADYFDKTPVGTVMYPLKEPVDEISNFGSDVLPMTLRIVLTTGFTVTAMILLNPSLTLGILPLLPIFLAIRHYYRMKLASQADTMQSNRRAWNDVLQEHISSLISIQLLAQERKQERAIFRLLARTSRSEQHLNRTSIWFSLCSSLTVVFAMCAVIGYGGAEVLVGKMSVGSLVAFYGFVTQLFDPISGTAELYARAQKAFAGIRQVQFACSLPATVTNAPRAVCLSRDRLPQIEFCEVEFGYGREKNLISIPSLRILPGEHIAISGENGAGKSTFAKLIARLYEPSRGSIRIAGVDVREIELRDLRRFACYVPPAPALFDGTIASNLRFVRPAVSNREVDTALAMVGLSAIIEVLPEGLHQRVGPGGSQLSGGQRQRLALARAILLQPRILILDEATSCLDVSSEALVIKSLRQKFERSTLIVISHRPAILSTFPRVLVLSEGRIVREMNGSPVSPANESLTSSCVFGSGAV